MIIKGVKSILSLSRWLIVKNKESIMDFIERAKKLLGNIEREVKLTTTFLQLNQEMQKGTDSRLLKALNEIKTMSEQDPTTGKIRYYIMHGNVECECANEIEIYEKRLELESAIVSDFQKSQSIQQKDTDERTQ